MAVSTGQVTAGSGSALLCIMPPGPCSVSVSNAGTAQVWVAAGSVASTGNGFPVPSGLVVTFTGYQGGGSPLSVVTGAGSATAATVGFFVSSPSGQTGL
jgi:hypothetical protein